MCLFFYLHVFVSFITITLFLRTTIVKDQFLHMKEVCNPSFDSDFWQADLSRLECVLCLDTDVPVTWARQEIEILYGDNQEPEGFGEIEVTYYLTKNEKVALQENIIHRLKTRLKNTPLRDDAEKLIAEHQPTGEKDAS